MSALTCDSSEKRQKVIFGEHLILVNPPETIWQIVVEHNTFENPAVATANEYGRYAGNIDSHIKTYRWDENNLIISRGYARELFDILKKHGYSHIIEDLRACPPAIIPSLKGITLRPYQLNAVEKACQYDQGVIFSPTGSGKTLLGLEMIRRKQVKALILVHRGDLAKQWLDVIQARMGIKAGFIGSGQWEIGEQITIAMLQTLSSRQQGRKDLAEAFGLILVDEVHHVPCLSFSMVVSSFSAKSRYGLSATLNRRDRLENMIYRVVGPPLAVISKQEVEGMGATVPATIVAVNTGFNPGYIQSWNDYLEAITLSDERNSFIADLIKQTSSPTLVLTDRICHANGLSTLLMKIKIPHILLHGQLTKDHRENAMQRMKSERITIGTTGLLGEGIDVSHWSILIMGSPISSEIKLMQAIGRVVRSCKGKEKALIYDLKDDCAFSGNSFKHRFEIYKKNKIWVDFLA